jgi:hypothetical protein
VKSADPHRAVIFAEKQQHARFIGLQGEQADEQNHAQQQRQQSQREQPPIQRPRAPIDAAGGIYQQCDAPKQPGKNGRKHDPAAGGGFLTLRTDD